MRKEVYFFVLISFFLVNFCSALSTDMKESYSPGETIIVKVSGNIVQTLSIKQVQFIRAGNFQEVPMIYDLKKLGDSYYLWAISPKIANNYTLILKDVVSSVYGEPVKIEFRQNFSVRGNITDYSISPGFIIADKEFEIQVQLYADEEISISTNFPKERKVTLEPGTTSVSFPFENVVGTELKFITLGKYKVPAYLIGSLSGSSSGSASNKSLTFVPTTLTKTLSLERKNKNITFEILNNGKETMKDIKIVYDSGAFSLSPNTEITLKSGERKIYTLAILKENGIRILDQISLQSGELKVVLPIRIDFIHNMTENISILKNSSELYRCNELGGNICADNQNCKGTSNVSQEGVCCVGTCFEKETKKEDGSAAIGYFLVILVILGLGYLYWKYRKTHSETNPLSKKVKEIEKNIP